MAKGSGGTKSTSWRTKKSYIAPKVKEVGTSQVEYRGGKVNPISNWWKAFQNEYKEGGDIGMNFYEKGNPKSNDYLMITYKLANGKQATTTISERGEFANGDIGLRRGKDGKLYEVSAIDKLAEQKMGIDNTFAAKDLKAKDIVALRGWYTGSVQGGEMFTITRRGEIIDNSMTGKHERKTIIYGKKKTK